MIREKRREKNRTEKVELNQTKNDFLFWNQPIRCVWPNSIDDTDTKENGTPRFIFNSIYMLQSKRVRKKKKERRKRFESNTTILLTLWNEQQNMEILFYSIVLFALRVSSEREKRVYCAAYSES